MTNRRVLFNVESEKNATHRKARRFADREKKLRSVTGDDIVKKDGERLAEGDSTGAFSRLDQYI